MKNPTLDVVISVTAVCLTLGIATGLRATPSWQQQTPPVFRGGTTLVPLTVTVLDKKGNPVTDLKQADFTVLENKVRQDVRSFFPQPMTPRAVEHPGVPITRGATAAADPLEPATRRTFLLVLGSGRIQVPAKGVDGAIKFVRQNLLPQDLVAVMAFNRASEFTTRHGDVAGLLERYKREHERIFFEIREFRIRHRFGFTPLPESFQKDMDAVFGDLPIRSAADLLLGMDGMKPLTEPGVSRQDTVADVLNRSSRSPAKLSEQMISAPLLKVYAGISYLRPLEGQKHLVWLGRVFAVSSVDQDKQMAARANDARVILDIIHTTGVVPVFEFGISSAENMTEWTGGYYTGNAYADVALARVDARGRFSYLLGYAPTNMTLDGKYREIEVKVNRPDVTVVFQHGYFANPAVSPIEMRDLVTNARLAAAGTSEDTAEGIKLEAKASPISVFGRTEIRVDILVDAAGLSFQPDPSGHVATLDVQVVCGDAKQGVVGETTRRLDLTIDAETFQKQPLAKIPISIRLPASGPVKFVKVAAYEYASDQLGTVLVTLK
jgi:VWFA-related protein